MYPYFIFLMIAFGIPLGGIFFFRGRKILQYPKTILWSLFFVYTAGWFWDWLSVKTGVWRYDSAPTLSIWFGVIPIEELLFYFLGTLFIVSVSFLFLETYHKE